MRGTLGEIRISLLDSGIIPAHAGNTNMFSQPIPYEKGSSPRMRGTLIDCAHWLFPFGIIPAHAGNTRETYCETCPSRDHPRACGEHRKSAGSASPYRGSSPRMRGTRGRDFATLLNFGIIPAHAGNTLGGDAFNLANGDHPRACGEHSKYRSSIYGGRGSSPRMRGTQPGCADGHRSDGIIPAHAGNTVTNSCEAVRTWDHPRACGEHVLSRGVTLGSSGSSPRMRGTRVRLERVCVQNGIIPAHAGNTLR